MTTKFIKYKDIPRDFKHDIENFMKKMIVPMVQKQLVSFQFVKPNFHMIKGTTYKVRKYKNGR